MATFKVTIKGHGAGDGPEGAAALDLDRQGARLVERHRVEARGHRAALDEVWAEYEREHPEHAEPHHATVTPVGERRDGGSSDSLIYFWAKGCWDERRPGEGRGWAGHEPPD